MKEKFEIKYIETDSSNWSEEKESDTLLSLSKKGNGDGDIKEKIKESTNMRWFYHMTKQKQSKQDLEITQVRNLPTYFFICFLIVISVLLLKFGPTTYLFTARHSKYEQILERKFSFQYFSHFLSELDMFSKFILMLSQIILFAILQSLFSINRQNGTVTPVESLLTVRASTYSAYIFSFASMIALVFLLQDTHWTRTLTVKLGLVDDVIWLSYMMSTYLLCLMIYNQVQTVKKVDTEDSNNVMMKRCMILLMGCQLVLYIASVLIVSFYPATSTLEKFGVFLLLACMNSNSVIFVLTFLFFIFSLRLEFNQEIIHLNYKSDQEWFVDLEDTEKNIL